MKNNWRKDIADFYGAFEPSLYHLGVQGFDLPTPDKYLRILVEHEGGKQVNNSVMQCQQYKQLDLLEPLLNEDARLDLLETAYNRHGIPVPADITKRLAALKGEIASAWRAELGRRIIEHERRIDELRSNEEKKRDAETELEQLKSLRDELAK